MAAVALERNDLSDPNTWTLDQKNTESLERRILAGLRAKGYPATSVELDPSKLKGGYICDTMRVYIGYGSTSGDPHEKVARAEVTARQLDTKGAAELPKSVLSRPPTAILKMASPHSNDHDVAMRLRLYEREWHFYETLASRVPIRVPMHLGSVKDAETALTTEGVLLEDLEVPNAVLCPTLDDSGVLKTVAHIARQHAQFWNMAELSSGALGIRPHNSPWYQPGWGNDLASYWPRFEAKWRARGQGDEWGPGLPEEAFGVGRRIVDNFAWVQDALSSKPHTFNHGDVKPPNMFMMPGDVPAFIDWQYTAVGKGCQDVVFFLIEGYDVTECRRLEPLVMAKYHASLVHHGIVDYSLDDLRRDWKLACMHFPFYVALWFGTTPDDQLVDPGFPRRFVPRAFDAILRHAAHELLPPCANKELSPLSPLAPRLAYDDPHEGVVPASPQSAVDVFAEVPTDLAECQAALIEARAELVDMRRQRDQCKTALDAVVSVASAARGMVP